MKLQLSAGVVALALFATSASAAPAFISIGDLCGVADSNFLFHSSNESRTVVSNDGENVIFQCSLSDVFNDTGKAVHYNYDNTSLPCGTGYGYTYDWQQVLSASGNAKLICKINPNSDLP